MKKALFFSSLLAFTLSSQAIYSSSTHPENFQINLLNNKPESKTLLVSGLFPATPDFELSEPDFRDRGILCVYEKGVFIQTESSYAFEECPVSQIWTSGIVKIYFQADDKIRVKKIFNPSFNGLTFDHFYQVEVIHRLNKKATYQIFRSQMIQFVAQVENIKIDPPIQCDSRILLNQKPLCP